VISEVLCRDIEEYADALRQSPLLVRARAGLVTPAAVGRYLASIHYLLTQTPVHLTLARELATRSGDAALASYFARKLGEEQSHHEWAESDQALLAERFGPVAIQEPAATMFALVRNTLSLIETDPQLYLAYILFAEYFTVVIGPEWVTALKERCGIPEAALSAITQHVELDQHHVAEGRQEIDQLVSDEHFHTPMREALRSTMRHFSAFCDDLCAAA